VSLGGLGDAVTARIMAERRMTDTYAKGRVTAIDLSVNPVAYTVSTGNGSRRMPMVSPAALGDVVLFVDLGSEAFGFGPFHAGSGLLLPGAGVTPISFRSYLHPALVGPVGTLKALGYLGTGPITRADLDGILDAWAASHGGTTRNVTDAASWDAACAAAVPGDLIRFTANVTTQLIGRANRNSMPGANMTNGSAGLPIIVTCANGIRINVASLTNTEGALNIYHASHVWAVGMNTTGSTFGVRFMNCAGTAGDPIRIAWCDVLETGDAGIVGQGWYQTLVASGGTPTGSAGDEWGFTDYLVIEENTVTRPGRRDPNIGECCYLGVGSSGGWIGRAQNVWVRYNRWRECTSDYTDVKPGCRRVYVHDNEESGGAFASGAANQALYVSADLSARPAWYNYDPEIWYVGNRSWDGNLSHPQTNSSNYFVQASLAGVRVAFNIAWGFAGGGIGVHLRSERAASESQVAGEKWWIWNNLFWLGIGVYNGGAPQFTPAAFNSAWIDQRNNIGAPTTTGVQFVATADSFAAPSHIPAVGSISADAVLGALGAGSAFDLAATSALVRVGVTVADLNSYIGADIASRAIPTLPNPGPFQPA
jgi:hypothetical protein